MGLPSFRRLRRRRNPRDIATSRARWELFFFCWASFLACGVGTAQAVEITVALIEGRAPHLLVPLPRP